MAATLTSNVRLQVQGVYQNTVGLASAQANIDKALLLAMASGTGANQADKIFSELAKSISGNYDVDLSGSLTDAYGTVIAFARVKLVAVFADSANPGNVIVGGAAATQWPGPFGAVAQTVAVRPGGAIILFAPDATAWPVVNAASDLLRFAPSAGTCLFDWVVIGASV
jgi:hypothetical protein